MRALTPSTPRTATIGTSPSSPQRWSGTKASAVTPVWSERDRTRHVDVTGAGASGDETVGGCPLHVTEFPSADQSGFVAIGSGALYLHRLCKSAVSARGGTLT